MRDTTVDGPEVGQLVRVRGQQWVVSDVDRSTQPVDELAPARLPGRTMVTLTSVSDDDLGDELRLVWEVEPGRDILPATQLPPMTPDGWDDPQRLGAFLDAVRWGTVASADTRTLQAPFRAGITIEEYQLERAADVTGGPDAEQRQLLVQLRSWADRYAELADSKAIALVAELGRICRPDGRWNDQRVIVFTEYVDTQRWLAGLLERCGARQESSVFACSRRSTKVRSIGRSRGSCRRSAVASNASGTRMGSTSRSTSIRTGPVDVLLTDNIEQKEWDGSLTEREWEVRSCLDRLAEAGTRSIETVSRGER